MAEGAGVVRYDAAIIGAGSDGLAAAIVLARAGLKVRVLDRGPAPGGALQTREFHPGFRASPFSDRVAPIPADIFWSLGLARAGAIFAPPPQSLALWPDGDSVIGRARGQPAALLLGEAARRSAAVLARASADVERVPPRFAFFARRAAAPWPGEDWTAVSLADLIAERIAEPRLAAHALSAMLAGRTADPLLGGSALHLLAAADAGALRGGNARLASALAALATEAGAEIACGVEILGIRRAKARAARLALGDGSEIEARALISTLDLKQTFLSFFAWNDLPEPVVKRAGLFRMGSGAGRVLFALDAPPELPSHVLRSPLHVMPDGACFTAAAAAAQAGLVPDNPPLTLRFGSATDPGLAPAGKAVMTATLCGIPYRLFDGAWTREKRDLLRDRAIAAAEAVLPGIGGRVLAAQVTVPPDMEEALGATEGDLVGGEIASDQMLGFRPWLDGTAPRTPVDGLYLAGPSTAAGVVASCASGVFAARAVLADMKAGRLR